MRRAKVSKFCYNNIKGNEERNENKVQEKQRIIIFGSGETGRRIYDVLRDRENVLFFVDNNAEKWGEEVLGLEIKKPDVLADQEAYDQVVVGSAFGTEDIAQQLKGLGVPPEKIDTAYAELLAPVLSEKNEVIKGKNDVIRQKNEMIKDKNEVIKKREWTIKTKDRVIEQILTSGGKKIKPPLKKLQFEVHLTEHCNLNCVACTHFSPLAEPEFLEIEEFRRDMEQLGNIFSHECSRFFLLGGEPLLHPDIIPLMEIAREHFAKGPISIMTNGILLPQKEEDFWRACHDNNVKILISHYPIEIDVEKIMASAREFGVSVTLYGGGRRTLADQAFTIRPLNLEGTDNIQTNFATCHDGNGCITLSHGRLFTCAFSAHVHHFNKKFNKNIPVTEADYVDIYKVTDKDEIFERLSNPIPICRFCGPEASLRTVKWRPSERDISEWV